MVWDWLSSAISKLLVWFWFYDTRLKTALCAICKTNVTREFKLLFVLKSFVPCFSAVSRLQNSFICNHRATIWINRSTLRDPSYFISGEKWTGEKREQLNHSKSGGQNRGFGKPSASAVSGVSGRSSQIKEQAPRVGKKAARDRAANWWIGD